MQCSGRHTRETCVLTLHSNPIQRVERGSQGQGEVKVVHGFGRAL